MKSFKLTLVLSSLFLVSAAVGGTLTIDSNCGSNGKLRVELTKLIPTDHRLASVYKHWGISENETHYFALMSGWDSISIILAMRKTTCQVDATFGKAGVLILPASLGVIYNKSSKLVTTYSVSMQTVETSGQTRFLITVDNYPDPQKNFLVNTAGGLLWGPKSQGGLIALDQGASKFVSVSSYGYYRNIVVRRFSLETGVMDPTFGSSGTFHVNSVILGNSFSPIDGCIDRYFGAFASLPNGDFVANVHCNKETTEGGAIANIYNFLVRIDAKTGRQLPWIEGKRDPITGQIGPSLFSKSAPSVPDDLNQVAYPDVSTVSKDGKLLYVIGNTHTYDVSTHTLLSSIAICSTSLDPTNRDFLYEKCLGGRMMTYAYEAYSTRPLMVQVQDSVGRKPSSLSQHFSLAEYNRRTNTADIRVIQFGVGTIAFAKVPCLEKEFTDFEIYYDPFTGRGYLRNSADKVLFSRNDNDDRIVANFVNDGIFTLVRFTNVGIL